MTGGLGGPARSTQCFYLAARVKFWRRWYYAGGFGVGAFLLTANGEY
jgi:hypothetical protein